MNSNTKKKILTSENEGEKKQQLSKIDETKSNLNFLNQNEKHKSINLFDDFNNVDNILNLKSELNQSELENNLTNDGLENEKLNEQSVDIKNLNDESKKTIHKQIRINPVMKKSIEKKIQNANFYLDEKPLSKPKKQKIERFVKTNWTLLSSTRYKIFLFIFGPNKNIKSFSWWFGVFYSLIFVILALVNVIPLVTNMGASIQPTTFAKYNYFLIFLFFADWLLSLIFSDCFYKGRYPFWKAVVKHVFDFFTIINLLSWSLALCSVIFKWNTSENNYMFLPIFILLRSLAIFKTFVFFSRGYNKWKIFILVVRKNMKFLIFILFLLIFITFVFALLVYNIGRASPTLSGFSDNDRKINTFFDAFWLSFLTITTIGYGDVFPITASGRIVIIFLSILV